MKIHQRNAILNMNCQKKELMNLEIDKWTLWKPKNREGKKEKKKNMNRGSGKQETQLKDTNMYNENIRKRKSERSRQILQEKNG